MSERILRFWDYIPRFCPVCDAPFWEKVPLCGVCTQLVLDEIQFWPGQPVWIENIPVYPLFHWKEGESRRIVPELIYLLKQGKHPDVVRWLSHFCFMKYERYLIEKPLAITPAPPRRLERPDHAVNMAKAIHHGSRSAIYYAPLLRTTFSQKTKSQSERRRQKLQFSLTRLRRYSLFRKHFHYVFVDDVVTTGSTVLAAYKALGKPEHFCCVTLAYRPLK